MRFGITYNLQELRDDCQPSPGKVSDHSRTFSLGTFQMAGPSQIAFVSFPSHTQFNRSEELLQSQAPSQARSLCS